MVSTLTNMNKTNNRRSLQTIEHKGRPPHMSLEIQVQACDMNTQYDCFESFPFRQNCVIFVARSRDFDGMLGTGLPVSMYTTKTPIDMCCFNVRSSTLKKS